MSYSYAFVPLNSQTAHVSGIICVRSVCQIWLEQQKV